MNDQEIKQKISLYLEATEKLNMQSKQNQVVGVAEKKKIFQSVISDMGVSEKERLELEKVGKQFYALAKESYAASNYSQSAHFCSKSLEILPFEIETLEMLMESHFQLSHLSKAQEIAASILQMDPSHKEALRIQHHLPESSSSVKSFWYFATGVFLLTLVTAILVSNKGDEETPPKAAIEQQSSDDSDSKVSDVNSKDSPDIVMKTDAIPINVYGLKEGISLENRETELTKHKEAYSFYLRLNLKNVGSNEIGEIKAKIILFDSDNNIVEEELFDLKQSFSPPLRYGESYGVERLIFKKTESIPNISRAHLEFRKIHQVPASKTISKEPVSVEWKGEKPEQFSLKIERRLSEDNLGRESIVSKFYARNVYEITNTGEGIIRQLQLKDEFFDESNALIGSSKGYVTISSYPYIGPNETRLVTIGTDLDQKASSIRLTVITIK